MTFPLITATGDPAGIGASYGAQARDLIVGNLDDYRTKFAAVDLEPSTVTRLGEQFRVTTHAFTPRIAATLDA
ncbi:MAG: hypothetical protein H0T17_01620, partial [Propionibacteriales bacterium]|nr:hypothetical protein [Propionibacteriales bacterium]